MSYRSFGYDYISFDGVELHIYKANNIRGLPFLQDNVSFSERNVNRISRGWILIGLDFLLKQTFHFITKVKMLELHNARVSPYLFQIESIY